MKRQTARIAIVLGAVCSLWLMAGVLFASNQGKQPDTVASSERVLAQTDYVEEQINLPPIAKEPPVYPNLDTHLNQLAQGFGSMPQSDGTDARTIEQASEPILVTFYVEPEKADDVRQYLEDNGIFVRNAGDDYIEAHVPPSVLGTASEQPGVLRVDTVVPPRPSQSETRVVSQGVGLHGADAWHNVGYRGDGVKVGIIDVGFEGFRQLQRAGELPPNVVARCYFAEARPPTSRLSDCEKDGDHGVAVAETIADFAPNGTLYVADPYTAGDMQGAARWMTSQGVQVINHSGGWSFDGPGDGTSPSSKSPLRTIDAAVSNGATWVNAAGNNARRTWYGTFRNPDRSTTDVQFHHWSSSDVGNSFEVQEGSSIIAFMRWDDSWGAADCDLDLVLWRSFPATQEHVIVDADLRFQDGSRGSVPLAIVSRAEVASWQEGLYFLTISKDNPRSCPIDPAWIQLVVWVDYPEIQYHSPSHHIGNPEESRNAGMMAVGATHHWATSTIAPYSNRGPTVDGRTKPDITGVACGRSTIISPLSVNGHQCWFPGTSASAPHVAGLAALVRQRFPDFDPASTVGYLEQHAVERGRAGADNTWGHGLAALPSIQATPGPTPIPTPAPAAVPPVANITMQDGISAGEVVISWDVVPSVTYYRIGYVNMVKDYPLAKASNTGEWIEAFVYVDVNALNVPATAGRASYTLRRLVQGDRHAFTVLASGDVENTTEYISGRYAWPRNPRWQFHTPK